MMTAGQALATVCVVAGATLLTRALPFLIFSAGRKTPAIIAYLGKTLPFAIVGMLVVYCLKDTSIVSAPHGAPELLGVAMTAGLYLWRKNTLLAIAGGTALYMVLVQVVWG